MTDRQRKAIFEYCRKLGMDDDARRAMAGGFRLDGTESTKGMDVREAGMMIVQLKEMWRQRQLKRHRRVDDREDRRFASERIRRFAAEQAKALFGEKWEAELDMVIARQNGGTFIPWHSPIMPAGLFWKVTEEIKARVSRERK